MADTAKDILGERIEQFKELQRSNLKQAKEARERAERLETAASECGKAIADLEAALAKLRAK